MYNQFLLKIKLFIDIKSPSSRGLGHRVFISATGVRLPLGTPQLTINQVKISSKTYERT